MAKVVLIEDDEMSVKVIEEYFSDKEIKLKKIYNIKEAREFAEDCNLDDIDLIIMDACVPGNEPTTMNLIKTIRKRGFKKPIVSSSSCETHRMAAMQVGASHESSKLNLHVYVCRLLGI